MSFVWTAEEADYLKAVLRWQDTPAEEEKKKRKLETEAARRKQAAGEIRILVLGAKGAGKTSVLTQFGQGAFRGEGSPPDPFYERGCRHTVEIDGLFYMVDALEMPSQQLSSNTMLEQAISLTEAAVLVYDVKDAESFAVAKKLAEFVREKTSGRREYGLMLVGNKSDADDEVRMVPWAEGSKAAGTFQVSSTSTQFVEVSCKTGDNIDRIFAGLGKDVLQIKRLNQQRKEQAEKKRTQMTTVPAKRRLGFWRTLATPFSKRSVASAS